MTKARVYNLEGKEVGEAEFPASLFAVPAKVELIAEVARGLAANRRVAVAHTKPRGEVRGGGKKPWRQKGTGRARHGSIRSPLWIGGGVVFGPRSTRNWSQKINRQVRRAAVRMVLSDRAAAAQVLLLDRLDWPAAKTKHLAKLIKLLPVGKNVLLVLAEKNEITQRIARNLPRVKTVTANALSLLDLLRYETLLLPQAALPILEKLYG